jgi:hypothetical protein
MNENRQKLAFGELEAPAGAGFAVLFPFHHPRITGKVAVAAEAFVVVLIYLAQRPRKTVAAGACLAVNSAAVNADQHVEFILTGGNHQWLPYHQGMLTLGKILAQILSVYRYFPASVPQIHPGHGSFPAAGSYSKILYHLQPHTSGPSKN